MTKVKNLLFFLGSRLLSLLTVLLIPGRIFFPQISQIKADILDSDLSNRNRYLKIVRVRQQDMLTEKCIDVFGEQKG
jgi:hypothetical protein